jgi:hypothetical protein
MRFDQLKRREFITLLGGAATSSSRPLPLRAQTAIAVRRVGILSTLVEDNPEGRNIHLEQRWSGGDNDRLRSDARGLANLRADVILAVTTPAGCRPQGGGAPARIGHSDEYDRNAPRSATPPPPRVAAQLGARLPAASS